MNILLVGNGFDVAHNLETKYLEFLRFVERFEGDYSHRFGIMKEGGIINNGGRKDLECIEYLLIDDMDLGKRLHKDLKDNIWLNYFNSLSEHDMGSRWIDFEAEIEKVIVEIDKCIGSDSSERRIDNIPNSFFENFVNEKKHSVNQGQPDQNSRYSYDMLLEELDQDLIRLTNALEIYLFIYVERYGWKGRKKFTKLPSFDKVLSFNYTDTYMRLYDPQGAAIYSSSFRDISTTNNGVFSVGIAPSVSKKSMFAEYCYVHGRVRDGNGKYFDDSDDRIVLGISDEDTKGQIFINDEEKYHDFQKFVLRERYGEKTYIKWFDEMADAGFPHELYIIGHSMAYSDRDILAKFLLQKNLITTIYYVDDEAKRDINENVIRIIGKSNYKELVNTSIFYKHISELY